MKWMKHKLESRLLGEISITSDKQMTESEEELKSLLMKVEEDNEFVFTASEQQFYADKGFQNEPGRCKACRDKRKAQNGGFNRSDRPMYDVVCAECGQPTQVPFQPRGDRPVYCRACFEKQRMESNRW